MPIQGNAKTSIFLGNSTLLPVYSAIQNIIICTLTEDIIVDLILHVTKVL
jgi:hypothetical protein